MFVGDTFDGFFVSLLNLGGLCFDLLILMLYCFHYLIEDFVRVSPFNLKSLSFQKLGLNIVNAELFDGFFIMSIIFAVKPRVVSLVFLQFLPETNGNKLTHL